MGILNLTPDSFSGDGLLVKKSSQDKFQIDLDAILDRRVHLWITVLISSMWEESPPDRGRAG